MVAVGEFDEPRVVLVPANGLVECSSHRIVSLVVVAVTVAARRDHAVVGSREQQDRHLGGHGRDAGFAVAERHGGHRVAAEAEGAGQPGDPTRVGVVKGDRAPGRMPTDGNPIEVDQSSYGFVEIGDGVEQGAQCSGRATAGDDVGAECRQVDAGGDAATGRPQRSDVRVGRDAVAGSNQPDCQPSVGIGRHVDSREHDDEWPRGAGLIGGYQAGEARCVERTLVGGVVQRRHRSIGIGNLEAEVDRADDHRSPAGASRRSRE